MVTLADSCPALVECVGDRFPAVFEVFDHALAPEIGKIHSHQAVPAEPDHLAECLIDQKYGEFVCQQLPVKEDFSQTSPTYL